MSERQWGASYKDAICPVCGNLRPISETEVCCECWKAGKTPLTRPLEDILAEMRMAKIDTLRLTTDFLGRMIRKLEVVLGVTQNESMVEDIKAVEDRRLTDEDLSLPLKGQVSMGCAVAGPSPCSICDHTPSEDHPDEHCGHQRDEHGRTVYPPTFDVEPAIPEPIKVTVTTPHGPSDQFYSAELMGVEPPINQELIGIEPPFNEERERIWLARLEDADNRAERINTQRIAALTRVQELERENERLRAELEKKT